MLHFTIKISYASQSGSRAAIPIKTTSLNNNVLSSFQLKVDSLVFSLFTTEKALVMCAVTVAVTKWSNAFETTAARSSVRALSIEFKARNAFRRDNGSCGRYNGGNSRAASAWNGWQVESCGTLLITGCLRLSGNLADSLAIGSVASISVALVTKLNTFVASWSSKSRRQGAEGDEES